MTTFLLKATANVCTIESVQFEMEAVLAKAKSILSLQDLTVDNFVFKLFAKYSFGLCLVCAILTEAVHKFGDGSSCYYYLKDLDNKTKTIFEEHCWLHGDIKIGNNNIGNRNIEWIGFLLLFNAILFRLPFEIWKFIEGGKIEAFCSEEAKSIKILGANDDLERLVKCYAQSFNRAKGNLKHYYNGFLFCQILNPLMVLANFGINDYFLGREYLKSGPYYSDIFPSKVDCTLYKTSVSGLDNTAHGFCSLPHYVINENIFFYLWIWFVVVAIIGVIQLGSELKGCVNSECCSKRTIEEILTEWQIATELTDDMKKYLRGLKVSDRFFLHQIRRNVQKDFFYHLILHLTAESQQDPPQQPIA